MPKLKPHGGTFLDVQQHENTVRIVLVDIDGETVDAGRLATFWPDGSLELHTSINEDAARAAGVKLYEGNRLFVSVNGDVLRTTTEAIQADLVMPMPIPGSA